MAGHIVVALKSHSTPSHLKPTLPQIIVKPYKPLITRSLDASTVITWLITGGVLQTNLPWIHPFCILYKRAADSSWSMDDFQSLATARGHFLTGSTIFKQMQTFLQHFIIERSKSPKTRFPTSMHITTVLTQNAKRFLVGQINGRTTKQTNTVIHFKSCKKKNLLYLGYVQCLFEMAHLTTWPPQP